MVITNIYYGSDGSLSRPILTCSAADGEYHLPEASVESCGWAHIQHPSLYTCCLCSVATKKICLPDSGAGAGRKKRNFEAPAVGVGLES